MVRLLFWIFVALLTVALLTANTVVLAVGLVGMYTLGIVEYRE